MYKFIKKLETNDYRIGSFDAFLHETKKFIKEKFSMTDEEVEEYLKQMPTTYRGSIVDDDDKYVGFIGIKNVDVKNESADIVIELNDSVDRNKKSEILKIYKMYLDESLNITKYNLKNKKEKNNFIKSKYIIPGIDENTLEKYVEMYPDMPKLTLPATISINGTIFGVIGLSNVIRSNKRADLRLYLDKSMETLDPEFIAELINNYLAYAHRDNFWNINFEIGANNENLVDALNESKMSYYGTIPFADVNEEDDTIGNILMFQHTPQLPYDEVSTKSQIYVSNSIFNTQKKEMDNLILLDNGYEMVKPSSLLEEDSSLFENALYGYTKAMSDRNDFTIPLGFDKYFPQRGNENYGLYKALKNYSYIILDDEYNFVGFIDLFKQDKAKRHCEIEMGIIPSEQSKGIGRMVVNKFYEQLFALGYASVTHKAFKFNDKSNRFLESIADYNGKRINSYYINGMLWDMNIYTKLNPLVEKVKIK